MLAISNKPPQNFHQTSLQLGAERAKNISLHKEIEQVKKERVSPEKLIATALLAAAGAATAAYLATSPTALLAIRNFATTASGYFLSFFSGTGADS